MKSKRGSIWTIIGSAILMLLILLLLNSITHGFLTKFFTGITNCQSAGGVCDVAGAPGRQPLGFGPYTDCQDKEKSDPQNKYACYKLEKWASGGGMAIESNEPAADGANLRMARVSGDYSDPDLAGKAFLNPNFAKGQDTSDRHTVVTGEKAVVDENYVRKTIDVYAGHLYAFYGLILNDKDYPLCEIYIRSGGMQPGTSNIVSGTFSKSRCDDAATWSTPIYFIPKAGDTDLQVVMQKKTSESDTAYRPVVVADLNIIASPSLSYNKFKDSPKTDVKSLIDMTYLTNNGKAISFTLDDSYGTVTFSDIVIPKDATNLDFNFDADITLYNNEAVVRGDIMKWIPSGKNVKVTIKRVMYKGPPNPLLTMDDRTGGEQHDYKRKTCDSPICDGVSFAGDYSVTFNADVSGKDIDFLVMPGSCNLISSSLCPQISSLADGLACEVRGDKCVKCVTKACSDYTDVASCDQNSCGIESKPDACTWMKKTVLGIDWLAKDGCVSCANNIHFCKDYKEPVSCADDACKVGGGSSESTCNWDLKGKACADSRLN